MQDLFRQFKLLGPAHLFGEGKSALCVKIDTVSTFCRHRVRLVILSAGFETRKETLK